SLTWSARTLRDRVRAIAIRGFPPCRCSRRSATGPGMDPLGRHGCPDHGGNTELAGEHGRVRRRPAGVRDQAGDLGEQHDPGRVRHLTYQDVTVADLVELVDGPNDASDACDRPCRRSETG